MKFSFSVLNSVLLASTALAVPQKNYGLARRLQRQSRTIRQSVNKAKNSNSSTKTESTSASTSSSAIQYSENWSGMAITSPPTGQTFNAVSGKFTVPIPSIPDGVESTDGEYSASAWVGIDGNTYSTAILQTGLDFTVSSSGVVSYDAWYEWYPDTASDFNLAISAGDIISLYVNATTSTSGSATIENLTTGHTVTKSLTSTSALGGQNAGWIIEDYEEGSSLVAFADFGNVTFSNCVASTNSTSEGISSAQVMEIENTEDEVLTSVSRIDDESFEVAYTSSGSGSGSGSGSTTTSGSGSSSSGTSGLGGLGSGMGFGDLAVSSGAGSRKGFPMLRRFLWGRPSTSGGL